MKICIIGIGYVGLVSGACFADLGNTVWCVDKNEKKIEMLNNNQVPIFEPGIEELINKNYNSKWLKFTTNLSLGVKNSDFIFICVGTPTSKKKNSAELKYVFQAVKEIAKYINKFYFPNKIHEKYKKFNFKPIYCLKILSSLMSSQIIKLMKGEKYISIKALEGYISFHHLLIKLSKEIKEIKFLANKIIKNFISNSHIRHKNKTKSLKLV